MDLDPRLQDLTPADLHSYQFAPTNGFDTGYSVPVYGHGLSNDHNVPAHAQQQFLQDGSGGYFNGTVQQQPPMQPSSAQRTRNSAQRSRVQSSQTVNTNGMNGNNSPNSTPTPRRNQHVIHPSRNQQPLSQTQYANHFAASQPSPSRPPSIQQSPSQIRNPPNTVSNANLTPTTPAQHKSNNNHGHNNHNAFPQASTPTSNQPSTNVNPVSNLTTFTHPSNFPLVPNPPDLEAWRERFFNITEPILLTSAEYHTYFPHVDNIYSHRSTQKYKRKPFVSHYWDCRLKGRPTGTPLSKNHKSNKSNKAGERDGVGAGEGSEKPEEDEEDGEAGGSTGTGKQKQKRKRKVRERDLCDVKIKVTEFFGRDELEALGQLVSGGGGGGGGGGADGEDGGTLSSNNNGSGGGIGGHGGIATNSVMSSMANHHSSGQLTFVLEDGTTTNAGTRDGTALTAGGGGGGSSDTLMSFGVLEPMRRLPEGHPGAEGKRWYMVQRVNGSGKEGDDADGAGGGQQQQNNHHQNLDHKHTLEESDRIKKNSVQRWLLAQEKEKKKQAQRSKNPTAGSETTESISRQSSVSSVPSFHASGEAKQTVKAHTSSVSTDLTLYASSFCPFAQRIWIALELKGIPYQFVEVLPSHMKDGKCAIPSLLEVCKEGVIPCIRHGNFAIWESIVVMEYLEDLAMGHSLLPLGNPQLRAHSRLWSDHISRKVLPAFYFLLLLPALGDQQGDQSEEMATVSQRETVMSNTLQEAITTLVNASHATGPFFLGPDISFVDVAFAPFVIRLSRIMSHYRKFPRPEVGTRWYTWVDAIERNQCVKRTVSDERSYHSLYRGIARNIDSDKLDQDSVELFGELAYAQRVVQKPGFGLGGDLKLFAHNGGPEPGSG